MRYNMISESGDGVGFAIRLVDEGENVRLWIRDKDAKSVGDGLVPKVGDLEDLVHDASPESDCFIFDVSGNGVVADFLRRRRFAVLGGSLVADRLERDREFGSQVMEKANIAIPHTESFNSFKDGIEFVEAHPESRWVYKPSKQLGDLSPSHVSYDTEDLVEMLKNVEKEVDIQDPQFELQEFVKGIAFSTELWFQDGQFIPPLTNHTLERKELMNGDLGPSGGCLGNIVWFCEGCRVCQEAKKLVPFFEKQAYTGMVDLNVLVAESDGGIYGLEFTPRFGYDASPTLFWELVGMPFGKFVRDISSGTFRRFSPREGFGSGLRITIPPWPSERYHADSDVPIRGLPPDYRNSTYLFNVKTNSSGLCSAGAWGILMLFTGYGDYSECINCKVDQSFELPTLMAEKVRVKNKQYRTDLPEQFKKDLFKLNSLVGD